MKPTLLEIPYNGQSFLIDIAEGNMVNLNKLHEFSGAEKGKGPKEWSKLPNSKKAIESINGGKSPIYKTKRGIGGGTWPHLLTSGLQIRCLRQTLAIPATGGIA